MKKPTNTISSKEACTLAHQIRRETGCSLAEAFKAAYNRNTAPVAPKTSWTAEELNQIFSDKAAELMRKGYTIDLAGMNGHQGEIGKMIFRKNGCWYALVMESQSNYEDGIYNDKYVIWFGKYTEDAQMRFLNIWDTPWLNKFEASWRQEYVKITDNYFVTPEVAKEANQKWLERCRANRSSKFEEVSSKYNKAILGCVRKQKGYKGVKASEIVKVTRITTYNSFKGAFEKRYYRVTLSRTQKNGRNVELDIRF